MQRTFTVVGLGEALWDLLPGGRQIGGAPTNFAYINTLLGDHGIIASRVGNDSLGAAAAERLQELGLDISYLQRDRVHPTGTVRVRVDRAGVPRFTIRKNVAWDFLSWTPNWKKLARKADAVCFGSLAQRSGGSRSTLRKFLRHTRGNATRVFDVNLRQTFYSAEVLRESVRVATIVKMNQDELPIALELLGLGAGAEGKVNAKRLLDLGPKLVCVTRGARGSQLVTATQSAVHSGFSVDVADTVGSGDAFTAALVHHYLRGASLAKMNDAANRLGSWVASQAGGTPRPTKSSLRAALGR